MSPTNESNKPHHHEFKLADLDNLGSVNLLWAVSHFSCPAQGTAKVCQISSHCHNLFLFLSYSFFLRVRACPIEMVFRKKKNRKKDLESE
jgi:hypothetical protein